MVYDCFIFFNELELLEIRLSLLNEVVDYFVIVESDHTFSGKKKEYNFKNEEKRYLSWRNKIIYIPIVQFPENYVFNKDLDTYHASDGAWQMEYEQRNALTKACRIIADDDLVLLSDLDEIPDPRIIKCLDVSKGPRVLQMLFHYYFLNCQNIGIERWWRGTIVCSGQYFRKSSPQLIRNYRFNYETLENGGWHFSYLGGVEKIKYKVQSFAHTEYNKKEFLQQERIKKVIKTGKDIFNRPEMKFRFNSILFYPVSLQKIMLKYPSLVYYPAKKYFFKRMRFQSLRLLYAFGFNS